MDCSFQGGNKSAISCTSKILQLILVQKHKWTQENTILHSSKSSPITPNIKILDESRLETVEVVEHSIQEVKTHVYCILLQFLKCLKNSRV